MNATLKEPIRFPDGMVVHCAHTRIVDISQLKPFPGNENDHPLEQIELLAHIMKDNGVRNPITVSIQSGYITKGHGRLLAAQMNGWTKFPVDDQNYESPAHETADRVADNKIAELSEIDPLKLKDTILKMPEGFDLKLTGIPELALKELMIDPNFAPGTEDDQGQLDQKKPVTCPACGESFVAQ